MNYLYETSYISLNNTHLSFLVYRRSFFESRLCVKRIFGHENKEQVGTIVFSYELIFFKNRI